MARLGWSSTLDSTALPTADANIGAAFADPAYDPGNAYSVPWQGGITGIAYDPGKVGRRRSRRSTICGTSALAGHVGMLTEMVDTMDLTCCRWASTSKTATEDDVERAPRRSCWSSGTRASSASTTARTTSTSWREGDLWATMAWSGDVFY